ncbi:MAG: lipopolysaccharide biosynthesis protein [Planctomycetota bacterium]|jgi:O-antigen/teichoic acid export membrane protein
MRQSYRLIYNALVSWASRLIEVAIAFLLLPFLVHRLGTAGYGIFGLAFSISQALDMMRSAVAQALNKYIAGYAAEGRQDQVNRVLGTACAFSIVFGLAGGAAMVLLRGVLAGVMNVAPEHRADFELALILMGVLVAVSFPLMPYLGVLFGFQRHDILRIGQTSVRALRAALMVAWFLLVNPSVIALVAITAICGGLLHLWWLLAARRAWPWLRGSPLQFRWDALKMLLGFSTFIILIQLTTILSQHAPRWILASMISVKFVTYVVVMLTPAVLLSMVIQDLTLTIMPVASKCQALNDRRTLTDLLIRGTRYSVLASGVCIALIIPIMRPFLGLWMGPDYEHLAPPVVLITACAMVRTSGLCSHNMLKGLGKVGQVLWRGIAEAVVSLGVLVVGIKWFDATYWAIAFALSAGYVVSGILHASMCAAAIKAPVGRFIWRSYAQPAVVLAPILVAGGLVARQAGLRSAVSLACAGIGSALLFAFGFIWLFFSADEWRLVRELWQVARRRVWARG